MSTSFIGNVSIIEVCKNVCSLYFMLEEFQKKSRGKCHNVVVREGGLKLQIACHNLDFLVDAYLLLLPV